MKYISRARREWFGGVVYNENPGFTAFVDSAYMDWLGVPELEEPPAGIYTAPLDVHLSITNRCNLACTGCYARKSDQTPRDMPSKDAKAIIDRLADMDVLTVAIGGGEPLLHPGLFEIAAHCRVRNIAPNITTNGIILDESLAARCRIFGSMHISCHDTSEMARLEKSIALLKAEGIEVGLNLLVSSRTVNDFPAIWEWCARRGVSRILLLKFKTPDNDQADAHLKLSAAQERSLFPVIRRLSRRHPIMPMFDCSFFPALACHDPKEKFLRFFDINGCQAGHTILAVDVDGFFKPCSFWPTTGGDARLLDKATWMQNELLNSFRQPSSHHPCGDCKYLQLCNGGCRVVKPFCLQCSASNVPCLGD